MARDLLSAKEIAASLGQPEPTAQQCEVIEAPMSPLLVVAGAGSGKTETMTGRVVWLVANGFVEPDQVLGLTFTRKAATELSERIGARLRLLQQHDVWHPRIDDDETGAEVLGGTPTVSTYHSYAGRLVREHALRLGYESESRLLSEAAAWQYASEVVAAYDGPMDDVQFAESTVTAAVVDLAGEIRDLETAQIAVQSSLTGHLVLATLHTNDAASAVTRLIDMGIEPFLLSSSLLGVLGQRLVRKLCPHCKESDPTVGGWRAVGCGHCGHTGYLGRTGIYELLTVNDEIRMLVHQGSNDTDMRRVAEKNGMINMRADAQRWIKAGITSQEETLRVTRE